MTAKELTKSILGMDMYLARYAIKTLGFKCRLTKMDGKSFIVTMDYRLDRINLDVENSKVIRATLG